MDIVECSQFFVASRCEYGGGYKLNADGALDMYSGYHGVGAVMSDGYIGGFVCDECTKSDLCFGSGVVRNENGPCVCGGCWLVAVNIRVGLLQCCSDGYGEDVILQRRKLLRMLFVVSFVLISCLLTSFHVKQNVVAHRVAHCSLNHQGVSFSDDVGPYD
ncbi:hypothetical protein ACFX15_039831 [Malus domestica]